MWKSVNYGEKMSVGDSLRYQSNSNSLLSTDEIYLVIRTDQHYFEIIVKADGGNASAPPDRKVVRYLDIGYNIRLDRWHEPHSELM